MAVRRRLPWRNFDWIMYNSINAWETMLVRTLSVFLRFGGDPNLKSATTRNHSCGHTCWQSPDCEHRGQGVLHFASAAGKIKVVDLLLKCGANPVEADDDGYLPVFSVLSQGREDVAIHLLQKCTDPTNIMVIQPRQSTALHVACRFASVRVVNFLLQNGANMYATDASDKTPLHEIAGQNTLELREQVSEVLQSLAREEARLEYIHSAHQTAATYIVPKHQELRESSKSPQRLTPDYNCVTGIASNSSPTGILSTTQTLAGDRTEPDIASQKLVPSLEYQHLERNEPSHSDIVRGKKPSYSAFRPEA